MRFLVAGGSGLVGRHVRKYFESKGYKILNVSRFASKGITYDEVHRYVDEETIVLNLAGKNIFGYWTSGFKRELLNSRVGTGKKLVDQIRKAKAKPKLFIQASAVGYYGTSRNKVFDEFSEPESVDFLSMLARKWEASTKDLETMGIRRVIIRLGVVLSRDALIIKLMRLPFKLGDGEQPISWIHVEDVCRAIEHFVHGESSGAYNLTSPYPTTNREMADLISEIYGLPKLPHIPAKLVGLVFGELARSMMLEGQKVVPRRLLEEGFSFKFPKIEHALRNLLASS